MRSLKYYLTLAKLLIKRRASPAIMNDEVIGQVAYHGMISENKFDSSRGLTRDQYIVTMMNYAISKILYIMKKQNEKAEQIKDEPVSMRYNPETIVSNQELVSIIRNKLDERSFDMLVKCYMEGMTYQEIANEYGLSREGVRIIIKKAKRIARVYV